MSLTWFAQLISPGCPQLSPLCQWGQHCPFLWPYWALCIFFCCLNTDQKCSFKRASHCLQSSGSVLSLLWDLKISPAISFSLWRCLWSSQVSEEEGDFVSWVFFFTWSAFPKPITKAILLFPQNLHPLPPWGSLHLALPLLPFPALLPSHQETSHSPYEDSSSLSPFHTSHLTCITCALSISPALSQSLWLKLVMATACCKGRRQQTCTLQFTRALPGAWCFCYLSVSKPYFFNKVHYYFLLQQIIDLFCSALALSWKLFPWSGYFCCLGFFSPNKCGFPPSFIL